MTSLECLTISNFRGFDTLEIDGLSKINLFVGRNNSGKTSVLESIFLLLGMSNPRLPNSVNKFRGLDIEKAKQLTYLFHDLNDENKPSFSAKFSDTSERYLRLEAKYTENESLENNSSITVPEITGVDLNFEEQGLGQNSSYKSSLTFKNNKLKYTQSPNYNEKLAATFIGGKDYTPPLTRVSEMIKRKEINTILETLKTFDANILDIKALPDGVYFDVKNTDKVVPINIMGDGIRRFLSIVSAVIRKNNVFICIDEIENGLHYSAYKLLWKSLLSFSNQNDAQLFISTHNIETLTCLKSVLEEEQFQAMQEYSKVFTISKTMNAGYKAYKYSFEGFKDAIDHEMEIRN